jgi:hypothetical protein
MPWNAFLRVQSPYRYYFSLNRQVHFPFPSTDLADRFEIIDHLDLNQFDISYFGRGMVSHVYRMLSMIVWNLLVLYQ